MLLWLHNTLACNVRLEFNHFDVLICFKRLIAVWAASLFIAHQVGVVVQVNCVSPCGALVATAVICFNIQLQVKHVPLYLCCCQIIFLFDWHSRGKQCQWVAEPSFVFFLFAYKTHRVTYIFYFCFHSRLLLLLSLIWTSKMPFAQTCWHLDLGSNFVVVPLLCSSMKKKKKGGGPMIVVLLHIADDTRRLRLKGNICVCVCALLNTTYLFFIIIYTYFNHNTIF